MKAFQPKPYAVFVRVHPTTKNGLKEPFDARVGPAEDYADALDSIEKDKRAMREAFGGLLPAETVSNREYSIFKANWERA